MQTQFECPQCHEYRLKITNNDVNYRSFGINLALAVICFIFFKLSKGMQILNLAAISGMMVFFIYAFSSMVKILRKREDKTVCEKCGYQVPQNNLAA